MYSTATSILTREEMERRRLEAAQALLGGLPQSNVASLFGVSRTTASRWSRALTHNGLDSLKRRRATGRPSRLSPEQMAAIPAMMAQGARAFGYPTERWTTGRVAYLIELRFGVRYDPDHVGRLLHKLGLRKRNALEPREEPVDYTVSWYSPNTFRNVSAISPTVA